MTAQTSYPIYTPDSLVGMVYGQFTKDITSSLVETAAGVGFGLAVSRGTDKDTQCVLGGNDFLGITVRSLDRESAANTNTIQYDEKESAGVMQLGRVWANCANACAPGDTVSYNPTTGRLSSGTGVSGDVAITGATWETTAANDPEAFAVLRIVGTSTVAKV